MLKKCLLWIAPLLLFIGSRAALFNAPSQSAPLGTYAGTADLDSSADLYTFTITLSKTSKDGQYLVSGQARSAEVSPYEIRGTYYAAKNRFAAFGEIRGSEGHSLNLDGKWNGSAFDITVKSRTPRSSTEQTRKLTLTPSAPALQTSVAITISPSPLTAGQIVSGKVSFNVKNLSYENVLRVSAYMIADNLGAKTKTPSASDARIPVPRDGNYELDLASLNLTCTGGSGDDAIGIIAMIGEEVFQETRTVEITRPQNSALEVMAMRAAVSPRGANIGDKLALTLDYRLQNLRSTNTKFTVTEKVFLQREGENRVDLASRTWHGEAPSLQLTGRGADAGPIPFSVARPGIYKVIYEVTGPGIITYQGSLDLEIRPRPAFTGGGTSITTGGGNQDAPGGIQGALRFDKSSVKPGEPLNLTFAYGMSGRMYAEADEVVELVGPDGNIITTSSKHRSIELGEDCQRRFLIDAYEPGTYTVRARVTGSEVMPFETKGSFTVEGKTAPSGGGTSGGTNPPAQGTYGLVKKEIGQAPAAGKGPYNDIAGTITESSIKILWTATRDYEGTFTFESKLSVPPAVLKPGEIIELTNESTANASHKNQPYNGAGTRWYVEGAEVLESTNAYAGWASNGIFYPSGSGKTRFKVGSGGTIRISSGYGGLMWGDGAKWNPCIYTYQWNAAPTVKPGGDDASDDDEGEGNGDGNTSMLSLDPDDLISDKQITARLEPSSITLKAGEISQIVHVHIGNFRTDTEDRVEVIFPQKTDNWASLPGQIVVGGGDGHYWPPNMGRPEHVDGFFFSARSTAPSGKQSITVIVRQKGAGAVRLTLDVTVVGKGGSTGGGTTGGGGGTTGGGGGFRGGPWAGVWDTNFGKMELKQDADSLTGTFGDADVYEIKGKVDGLVFTFKCFDGTEEIGSGSVTLASDGKTWSGTWMLFGEKQEWTGKRRT